jgi:hypothetical protein
MIIYNMGMLLRGNTGFDVSFYTAILLQGAEEETP